MSDSKLVTSINDSLYSDFTDGLLTGNKERCKNIVVQLLDQNIQINSLYTDLFQSAMYEVGTLWEHNKISVAVEHLATAITEQLLTLVYPRLFMTAHTGKRVVVSCVANEYHVLGGKMVADIFELHGWDSYFLGANTPLRDLLSLIDEKRPDCIALSLSIYFNMQNLITALDEIRSAFPSTDIFVGGQAFRWGGMDSIRSYPNTTYTADITQLETILER